MRSLFGKSLALKFNMKKGSIIKKDYITMKKPGFGFKENEITKIIGRKLLKMYLPKEYLRKKDIL